MHTYFFDGNILDGITLSPEESNHAIKVMRSQKGDEVMVINGKGVRVTGEIIDPHHKRCLIRVLSREEKEASNTKVIVAIAPTKSNDRIEFFLEKATEIGLDGVIPLMAKNNERTKVNLERWRKVILAAVKQSQRLWKPEVFEPMKVEELLAANWDGYKKLIAYCEELPEESILNHASSSEDVLLLIGPEGDFTTDEVVLCEGKGFTRVNLGQNRLRTETAGIVGVTLLKTNTDLC